MGGISSANSSLRFYFSTKKKNPTVFLHCLIHHIIFRTRDGGGGIGGSDGDTAASLLCLVSEHTDNHIVDVPCDRNAHLVSLWVGGDPSTYSADRTV